MQKDFVLACKWNPGCECQGNIEIVDLFPFSDKDCTLDGYSIHSMPICEKHLAMHDDIIKLAKDKDDEEIERVLDMSPQERMAKIMEGSH